MRSPAVHMRQADLHHMPAEQHIEQPLVLRTTPRLASFAAACHRCWSKAYDARCKRFHSSPLNPCTAIYTHHHEGKASHKQLAATRRRR